MKRLVIGLAVATALVIPGAQAVNARQERPAATRTHTVRPGETLWRIARTLDPSADPRAMVSRIVALNDLGPSPVLPGQKIELPLIRR